MVKYDIAPVEATMTKRKDGSGNSCLIQIESHPSALARSGL